MTAEEIFEKHISFNQEMKYAPIEKEDVMNCINEALAEDYIKFLKKSLQNKNDQYAKAIKNLTDIIENDKLRISRIENSNEKLQQEIDILEDWKENACGEIDNLHYEIKELTQQA